MSEDNIVPLKLVGKVEDEDVSDKGNPEIVLDNVRELGDSVEDLFVIVVNKDGSVGYSTTYYDFAEVIYLLEKVKLGFLMQ